MIIYRRLEEMFADRLLTILPVGGRSNVLKLFFQRANLNPDVKILFIADLDLWILSEVPERFRDNDLFFTDGYSIENDAYRDGNFSALMTRDEKVRFKLEMQKFCHWFAHCVRRKIGGDDIEYKCHPNRVLDSTPPLTEGVVHDEEAKRYFDRILADPERLLRGKSLMGLLMRQIAAPGRIPPHRSQALLDQAGASPGPIIGKLFDAVGMATGGPSRV